jgi:hypothetical protein
MAEKRTRASDVREHLISRPLSAREQARRNPKPPALRLRADAPALEVTQTAPLSDALTELRSRDVGVIALREPGIEPAAVVIPIERYFELVGEEILHGDGNKIMRTDHVVVPNESALAAAYVEVVNPDETWRRPR